MFEGLHYQLAYVTRDLDAAVADFRKRSEIRHEVFFDIHQDVTTPTGPRVMHNKLALLWVGNVQYEFIEAVSGLEDIYDPALPPVGGALSGFHHTCSRVEDWADFRRRVQQQALPVAFEGKAGPLDFMYLDARQVCGHYLEFTSMPEDMWRMMGGL